MDSDIIIWHLRRRREITERLKDQQRSGLPACSAISIPEVQLGVKTKDEEVKTDRFLESLKVFDVNVNIAKIAAQLIRQCKSKGVMIDIL